MKQIVIISLIIVICAASGWAQNLTDKVYFDEEWNVISDASKASYYRLYNANDQSTVKPFKDYYIDGTLNGEGFYSEIDKSNGMNFIMQGERKRYFKNGKLECRLIYGDSNLDCEATYYNDSTGKVDRILNFKNNLFDGRQVKYSPDNENEIWKEEFFEKGLMKKEITYFKGKVKQIYTLISRQKESFIVNDTWYCSEDEDSLLSKISVDRIYKFDPNIWYYPFQLYYIDEADQNGAISKRHGKFQRYDRQGRISQEGHYTYDRKSGIWKVYNYKQKSYMVNDYDDTESLPQYFTFDNQPFIGEWDNRYTDSKSGSVGHCNNGLMEGFWIWYDDYGRKSSERNYENGKLQGKTVEYKYHNDGELYLMWIENYVEGKLDGIKEGKGLTDTGEYETMMFYNYKNGILDGEFTDIHDSLLIVGSFKDGELDGYYKAYCEDSYGNAYIVWEGNCKNGNRVGEWTDRYPDENYYEIQNYTDNEPDRFFSYSDDTPFSGTIIRNYYDEQQKHVYTIKKSLIQQINVYDTQTGKQIDVIKFKNGLPINK